MLNMPGCAMQHVATDHDNHATAVPHASHHGRQRILTVALAKLKTNPVMLLCTRCAASVSSGWNLPGVNMNGWALTAVTARQPSSRRAHDLRACTRAA